ncbi:MAG: 50S ribosomal protein L3 [Armatimonadota bacterium]|nr:50S ribosomal protein L3 [Armatimonadota bacterium]
MVNAILGKKLGMTQIFDDQGRVKVVSVIQAGPCVVTQAKTVEKDGYSALQLGFEDIKENRINKPAAGHFAGAKVAPKRYLKEVRVGSDSALEVGQEIKADVFAPGDVVSVTGVSKGKGFAGVVKRWHFHGGDMTHGSMIHRKPQSGGGTDAARTFKGVKRPGRMGGKQITTLGLKIVKADVERNLLLIKGAVPGANGSLLLIKKTGGGE